MAGLLIKELLIRGSLERCLIIAPGSLVEQWQDELSERFDLSFDILSREQVENSVSGNPFADRSRLIARLDMLARNDELKAKLRAAPEWDLVIGDEAHRMSASFFGQEVRFTKRYQLGALAGELTRHLLLMTATPHNGKEEDFQLFMGLLDADRFEGRFREGVRKVDPSDMMRRMTKEELRRFDGSALLPRAARIHDRLQPLAPGGRTLRSGHALRARGDEPGRSDGARRRTAPEQHRLCVADPSTALGILAGGHPTSRSSDVARAWSAGSKRRNSVAQGPTRRRRSTRSSPSPR